MFEVSKCWEGFLSHALHLGPKDGQLLGLLPGQVHHLLPLDDVLIALLSIACLVLLHGWKNMYKNGSSDSAAINSQHVGCEMVALGNTVVPVAS